MIHDSLIRVRRTNYEAEYYGVSFTSSYFTPLGTNSAHNLRIDFLVLHLKKRTDNFKYFMLLYMFQTKEYLLTPRCRALLEQLTGLQLLKKFPRISRNPKVHHRTYNRPPPVCILGQPIPVHIPITHLLEIHLNIIPLHFTEPDGSSPH